MDNLDLEFIDEVYNMRLEIAFKRMLETRTHEEAKRVIERDEAIDVLYNKVAEECTDDGKKLFFQYADEIAYRESEDADFHYKAGFLDGLRLAFVIQKLNSNFQ